MYCIVYVVNGWWWRSLIGDTTAKNSFRDPLIKGGFAARARRSLVLQPISNVQRKIWVTAALWNGPHFWKYWCKPLGYVLVIISLEARGLSFMLSIQWYQSIMQLYHDVNRSSLLPRYDFDSLLHKAAHARMLERHHLLWFHNDAVSWHDMCAMQTEAKHWDTYKLCRKGKCHNAQEHWTLMHTVRILAAFTHAIAFKAFWYFTASVFFVAALWIFT